MLVPGRDLLAWHLRQAHTAPLASSPVSFALYPSSPSSPTSHPMQRCIKAAMTWQPHLDHPCIRQRGTVAEEDEGVQLHAGPARQLGVAVPHIQVVYNSQRPLPVLERNRQ